jgi:hypothetical protein
MSEQRRRGMIRAPQAYHHILEYGGGAMLLARCSPSFKLCRVPKRRKKKKEKKEKKKKKTKN